jgi:hypothetical protein
MSYHWFYEPNRVRIKLNEKYRLFLINKLKKLGGPHSLSRKIGCSPATICHYFKGLGLSIGFLKKILDILQISYGKIEPFITEISWIKNPKLPFNLNARETAILSAAILGDGSNTTRLMYKNTTPELIEKVELSAKKLFGKIHVDHRISKDGVEYILFPRIIGRVLTFMGVPYGNKINQNQGIPELIKKGNNKIKRAFLQQFFDDEGGVEVEYRTVFLSQATDCTRYIPKDFYDSMTPKKAYYIKDLPKDLTEKIESSKILIDIKLILEKIFGISSILRFKRIVKHRNHATSFWELEIRKNDDIERFFNEINFYSKSKRENLDFIVNRNYKMPWDVYDKIINESIEITKKQGFFRPYIIAKNLGLAYQPINKRIKILEKRGVFRKNKGMYTLGTKNLIGDSYG